MTISPFEGNSHERGKNENGRMKTAERRKTKNE
jgi:hypothetical protein